MGAACRPGRTREVLLAGLLGRFEAEGPLLLPCKLLRGTRPLHQLSRPTVMYQLGRLLGYFCLWLAVKISVDLFVRCSGVSLSRGTSHKFSSSMFRFLTYSFLCAFGYFVFRCSGDWVHDKRLYNLGWTKRNLPWEIREHYLMELSYYVFSTGLLFFEERMKDFRQMLAHHLVTLVLITLSYHYTAWTRLGSLIMIIHDLSDPLMEAAKLALYRGQSLLANILFVAFAASFFYLRDFFFTNVVVFSMWGFWWNRSHPDAFIFCILLSALQVIQWIWSWMIAKMILNAVIQGKTQSDIREQPPHK